MRLKPANIDYSMSVNNKKVFEHIFHKHRWVSRKIKKKLHKLWKPRRSSTFSGYITVACHYSSHLHPPAAQMPVCTSFVFLTHPLCRRSCFSLWTIKGFWPQMSIYHVHFLSTFASELQLINRGCGLKC